MRYEHQAGALIGGGVGAVPHVQHMRQRGVYLPDLIRGHRAIGGDSKTHAAGVFTFQRVAITRGGVFEIAQVEARQCAAHQEKACWCDGVQVEPADRSAVYAIVAALGAR
uniref:Uncharacterized protein eiAUOrf45 n=3 Tax=Viruses TaxID=10239 RepID=E7EKT4_9CAUD|nr:unknown [Edwardsiella phage eiAU]ADV36494.1 unknown [Edwardsiella phage eiDWF]ADV36543.1 unknown [Edwardsiella phage eiMSLS]